MESQVRSSPHPLIWASGIALIVFCGAGIAALMGWIPTSAGKPDEQVMRQPARTAIVTGPRSAPAVAPAPARAAPAAPATATPVATVAARCAECGVVQSVREVETKGAGTGLGAAGGAVVGGVLGNQVGGGSGKTVMTVVGAVGGAVAGNEIEKRAKSSSTYEVTIRFEDGSVRTIAEATASTWRAGDKVKVVNGVIQSNA